MADPYYHPDTPGTFFDFLVYVELIVQFPLALYLTRVLFAGNPLSGAGELAANVYGIVTGLCTAIVCNDMWHLGPDIISPQAKQTLLFAAYLPYAVLRKCFQRCMTRVTLTIDDSASHSRRYAISSVNPPQRAAPAEAGLKTW